MPKSTRNWGSPSDFTGVVQGKAWHILNDLLPLTNIYSLLLLNTPRFLPGGIGDPLLLDTEARQANASSIPFWAIWTIKIIWKRHAVRRLQRLVPWSLVPAAFKRSVIFYRIKEIESSEAKTRFKHVIELIECLLNQLMPQHISRFTLIKVCRLGN